MKILVTGGAGFIGSHLVDALITQGHEVSIVDNLSTGLMENVNPKARLYQGDIRNPKVEAIIQTERPFAVFHLAAQIDVSRSVKDPFEDAEINITGSLHVIEGARRGGVKKIIFSSTGGALYGETENRPTQETHETRPLTPYGIGKLAIENYLRYFGELYGFSYTSLRYSNVYGPRQNSKGETGVVAIFCDKMMKHKAVTINGDGTQTRDYVYVDDVVRANLLALESDTHGEYNVSTGVEVSVNELAALIQRLSGSSSKITHGPERGGDVQKSCLDYSKIEGTLGWKPTVSLEQGIANTIEWFRKNDPLSKPKESGKA